MAKKKITTLRQVRKESVKRHPWDQHKPIFRHAVTVYVDTFERSAERVRDATQWALDNYTGVIQPDERVTFEAATAVGCLRTEQVGV